MLEIIPCIELDFNGVFTAHNNAVSYHAMNGINHNSYEWHVVGPTNLSDIGHIIGTFSTLDEALNCLSNHVFLSRQFIVKLPCGDFFNRPGKMKAENILLNFGYHIARNFTGYALAPFASYKTKKQVISSLKSSFEGTVIELIDVKKHHSVSYVHYWMVSVNVLNDGPLQKINAEKQFSKIMGYMGFQPVRLDSVDLFDLKAEQTGAIVYFKGKKNEQ